MAPLLVVFSGPSGVGKDTLIDKLLESEPRMRKVATVTTRPPRPGEVEGLHHYFVSPVRFQELIAANALLEHARVYDNWYGVPRTDVDNLINDGWDVILRTDIQGVASIKRLAPHAVTIFIAPEDMADLEARLQRRGVTQRRKTRPSGWKRPDGKWKPPAPSTTSSSTPKTASTQPWKASDGYWPRSAPDPRGRGCSRR